MVCFSSPRSTHKDSILLYKAIKVTYAVETDERYGRIACMMDEEGRRESPWLCTRAHGPHPSELQPQHDPEFQQKQPTLLRSPIGLSSLCDRTVQSRLHDKVYAIQATYAVEATYVVGATYAIKAIKMTRWSLHAVGSIRSTRSRASPSNPCRTLVICKPLLTTGRITRRTPFLLNCGHSCVSYKKTSKNAVTADYWKGVVVVCARYGQSPKQTKTGEKWVWDCLRMMI